MLQPMQGFADWHKNQAFDEYSTIAMAPYGLAIEI